jgi:hypothetical protein
VCWLVERCPLLLLGCCCCCPLGCCLNPLLLFGCLGLLLRRDFGPNHRGEGSACALLICVAGRGGFTPRVDSGHVQVEFGLLIHRLHDRHQPWDQVGGQWPAGAAGALLHRLRY